MITHTNNVVGKRILVSQIEHPNMIAKNAKINQALNLCHTQSFQTLDELKYKVTWLIKDIQLKDKLNGSLTSEDENIIIYLINNNSKLNHDLLMYMTSWEYNKERSCEKRKRANIEDKDPVNENIRA